MILFHSINYHECRFMTLMTYLNIEFLPFKLFFFHRATFLLQFVSIKCRSDTWFPFIQQNNLLCNLRFYVMPSTYLCNVPDI